MNIKYPSAGVVSVWVGDFKSEEDFDYCVDRVIAKSLDLKVDLASICEVSYEEELLPIRKLIEGFSGWESFVDQVEGAARAAGVVTANAVLICYYLKCEEAPLIWGTMKYLGSFDGQDVGS